MMDFEIERLREVLIKACDRHIANGGKIISGSFRDPNDNGLCPLNCLLCGSIGYLMFEQFGLSKWIALAANVAYIRPKELAQFMHGFDNQCPASTMGWQLGQELRNKYLNH